MDLALALDIGGTKIEAALIDSGGAILEGSRKRVPTGQTAAQEQGALDTALRSTVAQCMEHPEWPHVTAVGIGSAGPINLTNGSIAPINLPAAHGYEVVRAAQAVTGIEHVTLRLDGTCIALAESWLGAAQGVRNALVMVVSTGVGGGVISGGRLVAGASGNAGHIGQVPIRDPELNVAEATVEGIASGPSTVAWARARGWSGSSGEDLAASFRANEPVAVAAVERSARAVGVGLISAVTLLDLELAVIGGGFVGVADTYTEMVQATVRENAVNAYAGSLRVVPAGLGGDSPLIGAAALAHRPDLLATD